MIEGQLFTFSCVKMHETLLTTSLLTCCPFLPFSCGCFCTKWCLSELAVPLQSCLWTGSSGQVLAPTVTRHRAACHWETMSCLYVSELTGKELCSLHTTLYIIATFSFWTVTSFSENRKDGTQWWKIFPGVGVIMIRLESSPFFFSGQYEFRCFDYDSSGDLNSVFSFRTDSSQEAEYIFFFPEELFLMYSGFCKLLFWILNFGMGWEILKSNPIFHVLYICHSRRLVGLMN